MNATARQHLEPQEEQFTTWHNPLSVDQRVDVRFGNEPRPTRYVIKAGGRTEIPSRFDREIQRVDCAEDECHRKPGKFCTEGHPGTILGGLAPQLRREGWSARLADALDPTLSEKKQKQAEVAAANIARTNAEQTMLIAENRRLELEAEQAAQAIAKGEGPKPAAVPAPAPAPKK